MENKIDEQKKIEGDKLIAGFMEIPVEEFIHNDGTFIGLYVTDEDGSFSWNDGIDWFTPEKDWNRLMPVVEKIKQLGYNVYMANNSIRIEREYGILICQAERFETFLLTIWTATVSFIKWHNLQNQSNGK